MGKGIRAREHLLDKYLERHSGRNVYERVKTRQNIRYVSREALNVILQCLYDEAPVESGYGRSAGIRYKQNTTGVTNTRLKNLFTIIVGSDTTAKSGQTSKAPYMAIQNYSNEYGNTGWIDNALINAKMQFKKDGIYVLIGNPNVISNYVTKGGTAPPAGYSIEIGTYMV